MQTQVKVSFKPERQGLNKILGELEAEVMEIVWRETECTARSVFEHLRERNRALAYSTVKTVLERLAKKNILTRTLVNNAYIYRPLASKEEFTASAMDKIVDSLLASFAEPVVRRFFDQIGKADPQQLARFAKLLETKK